MVKRESGLDSNPKALKIPSHFVPLFEKKNQEDPLKTEKFVDREIETTPQKGKRAFTLKDFWFPSATKTQRLLDKNQGGTSNTRMNIEEDRMAKTTK